MSKIINLKGRRFGKLTVTKRVSSSRNGHTRWECLCDCGLKKAILSTHLISGKITHCGCVPRPAGVRHIQWRGFGDISGGFWHHIERGANGQRGRNILDFKITIEYAWDLFNKQNGKCAISNLPLNMKRDQTGKYRGTASLDRIDSSIGYVEGNVQWVHKDINMMKRSYSQEYFIELCKTIAKNNP